MSTVKRNGMIFKIVSVPNAALTQVGMSNGSCLVPLLASWCNQFGLTLSFVRRAAQNRANDSAVLLPIQASAFGEPCGTEFPPACLDFDDGLLEGIWAALVRLGMAGELGRDLVMVPLSVAGLAMQLLNFLTLLGFKRMKAAGKTLHPLQLTLVYSDIVTIFLAVFWWMPVTEFGDVDDADLLCHYPTLGFLLRLSSPFTLAASLSGQGFILAACIDRVRLFRDPLAYHGRDQVRRSSSLCSAKETMLHLQKRESRLILAIVVGLSVAISFPCNLDTGHYRLTALPAQNPITWFCMDRPLELVRECARNNGTLGYRFRHILSFRRRSYCRWDPVIQQGIPVRQWLVSLIILSPKSTYFFRSTRVSSF